MSVVSGICLLSLGVLRWINEFSYDVGVDLLCLPVSLETQGISPVRLWLSMGVGVVLLLVSRDVRRVWHLPPVSGGAALDQRVQLRRRGGPLVLARIARNTGNKPRSALAVDGGWRGAVAGQQRCPSCLASASCLWGCCAGSTSSATTSGWTSCACPYRSKHRE